MIVPNNTPSNTTSNTTSNTPNLSPVERTLRRSNAMIFHEDENTPRPRPSNNTLNIDENTTRPNNINTNVSDMHFENASDISYVDTISPINSEDRAIFNKENPDFPIYNFEEDSENYTDISSNSGNLDDNDNDDTFSIFGNKKKENEDEDCKDINLDENEFKWIQKNCFSCKNKISLSPFDKEEYNIIISIKLMNSNNKFTKGTCFTKDDIVSSLSSDINDIYPTSIMSIYTTPNKSLDESQFTSGLTGKATGRIVIKLPIIDIFVTLNSANRILKEPGNMWYALELFGGKRRRIGNIKTHYGSSLNHGQIKGFKVYKLFTKNEIQNGITCTETRSDYPLALFLHDKMESLENILGVNSNVDTIIDTFKKSIINLLLNHNDNIDNNDNIQ